MRKEFILLPLVATLAACGGGGSSDKKTSKPAEKNYIDAVAVNEDKAFSADKADLSFRLTAAVSEFVERTVSAAEIASFNSDSREKNLDLVTGTDKRVIKNAYVKRLLCTGSKNNAGNFEIDGVQFDDNLVAQELNEGATIEAIAHDCALQNPDSLRNADLAFAKEFTGYEFSPNLKITVGKIEEVKDGDRVTGIKKTYTYEGSVLVQPKNSDFLGFRFGKDFSKQKDVAQQQVAVQKEATKIDPFKLTSVKGEIVVHHGDKKTVNKKYGERAERSVVLRKLTAEYIDEGSQQNLKQKQKIEDLAITFYREDLAGKNAKNVQNFQNLMSVKGVYHDGDKKAMLLTKPGYELFYSNLGTKQKQKVVKNKAGADMNQNAYNNGVLTLQIGEKDKTKDILHVTFTQNNSDLKYSSREGDTLVGITSRKDILSLEISKLEAEVTKAKTAKTTAEANLKAAKDNKKPADEIKTAEANLKEATEALKKAEAALKAAQDELKTFNKPQESAEAQTPAKS